jgi:deoxyhypusine synthase
MVDAIVTTAGSVEEDIMKATGEKFIIGTYSADDVELHEKGTNRVGNLYITNESYCNFESMMLPILDQLYKKQPRWPVSDMLKEIGLSLKDENSYFTRPQSTMSPYSAPHNRCG